MTRKEAYDRLRGARNELDAARFALAHAIRLVGQNLQQLQQASKSGINSADLARCRDGLELTYILRLFSEFEAAMRSFWVSTVRDTRSPMEVLINSLADRLHIAPDDRDMAHRIRQYRNDIVHQNPRSLTYTFADCLRALGIFLRWFPIDW